MGFTAVLLNPHKCDLYRVLSMMGGISEAFTGCTEMDQGRQEGSLAQHNSVASGGANSGSLTPGDLFWAYLSTAQFDENCSDDD